MCPPMRMTPDTVEPEAAGAALSTAPHDMLSEPNTVMSVIVQVKKGLPSL